MRRFAACLPSLAAALAACAGCTPCDRGGCDSLRMPAADDGGSAIAGTLASESDIVGNGCQMCPFTSATISIWPAPGPVADNASADAIVNGAAAEVTFGADMAYRHAFVPGSYLICVRPYCVGVAVVAGHVTPVNVKLVNGPSRFFVFDPVTRAPLAAPTLEVALQ